MNVLLWIFQVVLALFSFAGGAYKVFACAELAKMPPTSALPRGGWIAVGVFEIVCAILLIIPAATKVMPQLTPLAAVALAVESLAFAIFYARYSLKLVAANPLVWVVGMGIAAAFVAFGRYRYRS